MGPCQSWHYEILCLLSQDAHRSSLGKVKSPSMGKSWASRRTVYMEQTESRCCKVMPEDTIRFGGFCGSNRNWSRKTRSLKMGLEWSPKRNQCWTSCPPAGRILPSMEDLHGDVRDALEGKTGALGCIAWDESLNLYETWCLHWESTWKVVQHHYRNADQTYKEIPVSTN